MHAKRMAEQVHKLATTKQILKDDSPKDNILSEKAAKKIQEAGELHEIQQRTKYNVNVVTHTLRLDLSMSIRRKVEDVRRNAFQHQTKI